MKSSIEIFENKEDLIREAEKLSQSSTNDNYKHALYLYYIVRYFVSLYEANFGQIPIQVWNEYRNSLDHFFRDLTNKESSHIKKMEGHLQRAALDILKIYCHSIQDKIEKLQSTFVLEVIQLIDNGNFLKNLKVSNQGAIDLFINAKVADNSLGDNSHTNKEIVANYLEAAFRFNKINKDIIEKSSDIDYAKLTHSNITNIAKKGTFKEHIKTHYIFYISWTALTFLLQLIYNNFTNITNYISTLVSSV